MRLITSCSICRTKKRRCVAGPLDKAYRLCSSKGLRCDAPTLRGPSDTLKPVFPLASRRREPPLLQTTNCLTPTSQDSPLATGSDYGRDIVEITLQDQSLCEELINLYFKVIHASQHLLFHHSSFIHDQRKVLGPRYLLLGIIALSARFSLHPSFESISPWIRGTPFFEEAIRSFDRRPKLVSIEALQGCILLAFCAFTMGDTDRDALLSCQAIRMTQSLEIPTTLSPNGLLREIEINLYWQTWMMDCWTSVRSEWPLQLRNDPSYPRPLQREIFDRLTPDSPLCDLGNYDTLRESSMWGLILPLTQWHAEAVKLNLQVVTEPALKFKVPNIVGDLTIKLQDWAQSLPPHLQNTPENFRQYSSRGYGRLFAVIHIIYARTCQSLYYQVLAKSVSREGKTATNNAYLTYAELCRSHAVALSKLMWELKSAPDLDCLWSPVNSHLLVIASTIHLHTMLLQSDKPEATEAKKLLEQNFIILQELQKYWPSTELAFSRLQAFHNAYRVNSISKTFNIDEWMVKFLNRYNVCVQDRDLNEGLADIGASNTGDKLWGVVFDSD